MSRDAITEADHATLMRLHSFFLDEGTRCRWWQFRRAARLHHAFWAVSAVMDEVRNRGELRSPNMFTASDDPHIAAKPGGDPS